MKSNIITKTGIQSFYRAKNINLGYYDVGGVFPRTVTDGNNAFFTTINFCLRWKSEGVSFNQANQDLKNNFKIVDDCVTEENVKSHFEYIYKPKKNESHLSDFITYDLETHITDRARP